MRLCILKSGVILNLNMFNVKNTNILLNVQNIGYVSDFRIQCASF